MPHVMDVLTRTMIVLSFRIYFDKLVRDLEQLFVETSQSYTEQG
jgi:hypothetical protein